MKAATQDSRSPFNWCQDSTNRFFRFATAGFVWLLLAACTDLPSSELSSAGDTVQVLLEESGETRKLDRSEVHGEISVVLQVGSRVEHALLSYGNPLITVVLAEAPFAMRIDTTLLADGWHTLTVTIAGRDGKRLGRKEVTFEVRNADLLPEPSPEPSPAPSPSPTPTPEPTPNPPPPPDPEPTPDSDPGKLPNPDDVRLTWAPPTLRNPVTIHVPVTGGWLGLDESKDYVLVMPDEPVVKGFTINGGRNVVLIGGEIRIPWQGSGSLPESERRAIFVRHNKGTVHIEGLLIHGEDLGEGIHIASKDSVVQIQNVRIWGIHARDQVNFSDSHPDLIQTWGSVGELRVDKLSGSSDYQGLFFKADYDGPHGPVHLKRVNIHGDATARYLFWIADTGGGYPQVTLTDTYVAPAAGRSFGKSLWPDVSHGSHPTTVVFDDGLGGNVATWPSLPVIGQVMQGHPSDGDFVETSSVGLGYRSPGYL